MFYKRRYRSGNRFCQLLILLTLLRLMLLLLMLFLFLLLPLQLLLCPCCCCGPCCLCCCFCFAVATFVVAAVAVDVSVRCSLFAVELLIPIHSCVFFKIQGFLFGGRQSSPLKNILSLYFDYKSSLNYNN